MATRKSKLETVFTGDDRPFQRVSRRVEQAGKRTAMVGRSFAAGFAAIGGTMAFRGITEKFDRVAKLGKQYGLTSEQIQRFDFVAQQNGATIEQIGVAMRTANRAAIEAGHGLKTYQRAFEDLGISHKEFAKLDSSEQFLRLADAIANAEDRNVAFAAAQSVAGRGARELASVFQLGSRGIEDLGSSIAVATDESVANIEKLNDTLNRLAVSGLAKAGEGLGKMVDLTEKSIEGWKILIGILQGEDARPTVLKSVAQFDPMGPPRAAMNRAIARSRPDFGSASRIPSSSTPVGVRFAGGGTRLSQAAVESRKRTTLIKAQLGLLGDIKRTLDEGLN